MYDLNAVSVFLPGIWLWGYEDAAAVQVSVREKREQESTAGSGVSVLQKMSIETVSDIQNRYVSINRYFWHCVVIWL